MMETGDVPEGHNKTVLLGRKWQFKEKIGETVATSFEGERTNTGDKSSIQALFFTFVVNKMSWSDTAEWRKQTRRQIR